MRKMMHVLEDAIHNLDATNADYNFILYNTNLPLPGTGKEKHREIYVVRTNKEETGRTIVVSQNYIYEAEEKEEEAREAACDQLVNKLMEYALYNYQPTPKY